MHLFMLAISCLSGFFGLIILDVTFYERVQSKWLPFWIGISAVLIVSLMNLMNLLRPVPLVFLSIVPIVLLNWWMLSYMIHAKKILLLPVVLLVNALYRFVGAICGMFLSLLSQGTENTILHVAILKHSLNSIINMSGSALLTLPLIVIISMIAHHYSQKYKFVELLEALPADGYDYTILGIFSVLYLIVFSIALQYPVKWQAYAASVFTMGFAVLYFQLILSKYKRKAANEALSNLHAYGHALNDLNTNLEIFTHDYKNIMLSMTDLVNHGNVKQLQTYFKHEIQPTLQQFVDHSAIYAQLSNISDDYVRGILFQKYNQAAHRNIHLNVVVNEPANFAATTEHLNLIRILGNLLDNAFDAAEKVDRKVDAVVTASTKDIQIRISNHFAKDQDIDIASISAKYQTSKKNHHGLGMTSVSRAQNANIWVSFIVDAQTFSATVHIDCEAETETPKL